MSSKLNCRASGWHAIIEAPGDARQVTPPRLAHPTFTWAAACLPNSSATVLLLRRLRRNHNELLDELNGERVVDIVAVFDELLVDAHHQVRVASCRAVGALQVRPLTSTLLRGASASRPRSPRPLTARFHWRSTPRRFRVPPLRSDRTRWCDRARNALRIECWLGLRRWSRHDGYRSLCGCSAGLSPAASKRHGRPGRHNGWRTRLPWCESPSPEAATRSKCRAGLHFAEWHN